MNTTTVLVLALAAAQAPDAAVAQSAPDSGAGFQSVWDFVVKGGPMMIPIGLCSLVALAVIVERRISLRRKLIIPPDFLSGLDAALKVGDDGDRSAALAYCKANGSPIARVFAAGIKRLDEPVERREKHIQEAGEREVLGLRKFTRLLSVIASVAPLMGLLGTMFGMIRAFETVATSGEALGRTEVLAKGIYEALITTAAGLLLAIPVLMTYHWIAARIERLVADMDQMTVDFFEDLGTGTPAPAPSAPPELPVAAAAVTS